MIYLRAGVLAFLLCLGMAACASRPPSHEPASLTLPATSPDAILTLSDRRWQVAQALRALGRVSAISAQGSYSTRQTLLWQRPASLRLDTISLFGQPSMTLVADPVRTSIYYPQQATVYEGPATATTLTRFIGLPLDAEDVVPLLMGNIRPPSARQASTNYLQIAEGMYLLRFLDVRGKLIQDVWLNPDQLLPRRILRYTIWGQPAIDISYGDYRPLGGAFLLPHGLRIWLPGMETELRIQFLSIDLNPVLSPSVFHLTPPEGAKVVPLE